jgi:hypothetical protein
MGVHTKFNQNEYVNGTNSTVTHTASPVNLASGTQLIDNEEWRSESRMIAKTDMEFTSNQYKIIFIMILDKPHTLTHSPCLLCSLDLQWYTTNWQWIVDGTRIELNQKEIKVL